jgi:hypothetical protein
MAVAAPDNHAGRSGHKTVGALRDEQESKRGGRLPAAFQPLNSLVRRRERPQSQISLSGDPSEVTALETRHWITSFR